MTRRARIVAAGVLAAAILLGSHARPAAGAEPPRTLPACASDEGPDGQQNRGCVWDARAEGNGEGRSFVIRRDADAQHGTITFVSHTRAHTLLFGVAP